MQKRGIGIVSLILIATFASGCTSLFKRDLEEQVETTIVEKEIQPVQLEPRHIGDPLSEMDIELINEMGKVPVSSHKHVKKWLNYFQGRGKRHMERYLMRSTRYIPLMRKILKDEGVPEDLVYIALIESGFNAKAYSPAAAVGYWQFIRPTGKHYNLKITNLVDERRDVVASTKAAANYFKSLYNLFGSWHLAMASYNTGENRVKRAVMRYQTRDFWEIINRRKLPRETRNYVPKFLVASLIAHFPARFGFKNIDYQEEISFDTIHIPHGISLKKLGEKIGANHDELKRLNPALLSDYVPYYKNSYGYVRVPKGKGQQALTFMAEVKSKPPAYVAGNGFIYRVRRGDTISTIARRFRTSQRAILHNNNIRRRSFIRIGQRLRIPSRNIRVRSSASRSIADSKGYYKVRRGDSLSVIARRFRTTVSKLKRLNGLGRRNLIKVGMLLKVKEDSTNSSAVRKSRAVASKKAIYHKVRRGENLSLIAKKYRTSVSKIARLNGMSRRSVLKVGQRLIVRNSSGVHIVRRGETLSDIAERYKVSLHNIKKANTIKNASTIYAGTRIFIPHN